MSGILSVDDVVKYVKALDSTTKYLPNRFTNSAPDRAGYVRLHGGRTPSKWTTKKYPSMQIVVRESHPKEAETTANKLYSLFHNRRQFDIGPIRVISSEADQSAPIYLGQDEKDRFLYSINFTFVTI